MIVFLLVVILLVVLFVTTWTVRRHGEADQAHDSWSATDERFVDPSTGRTMRVYLGPDGTRHSVPDQS